MERRVAARGLVLLAAAGALLCALGPSWQYMVVAAATLVPLVVLASQLRRGTYADRTAWLVMVTGVAVMAAHNVRNALSVVTEGTRVVGGLADVMLAGGWTLLLAGGLLATRAYARRDRGDLLDTAVVGLVVASLMWAAVLGPTHARLGSPSAVVAYELFLVLVVTALTAGVLRTAVVVPAARAATSLLCVAMVSADLADIGFTLTQDPVTGRGAWWASALCVVALLCFSAALVHPSVREVGGPARAAGGLTAGRLAFLGVALAVNPAIAGTQLLLGQRVDVALISLGSLLMVPLVVARVGLLARGYADAVRRLHDLATLDELTGLPNRRAMTTHLSGLLDRVAAGTSPGAVVLFLDVDDFKVVNDTYGHTVGDQLLTALARRICAGLRSCDLVARVGGDEFVVVAEGDPGAVEASVVEALEQALAAPVRLGEIEVPGQASIGVAAATRHDEVLADDLVARADAAMYLAKRRKADVRPR